MSEPTNFCPHDGRALRRDTANGRPEFECPACHERLLGNDHDALIDHHVNPRYRATNAAKDYATLLRHAAHDPANCKVAVPCPRCALPVLTQIHVGDEMTVFQMCECGYARTGAGEEITLE